MERAGSDGSAALEYVDDTVASGGTLELAGIAAFADAPLASDASGTGTVTAPGAGVGIATASLDEKLLDGATLGAAVGPPGGIGPPGALVPEPPPPPPQAARSATPRTAPPRSAEIRFMHP
jgi:hypothetical protein